MPFDGRAHFVRGLDAFVGLSDDPDTRGHLCSCDGAAITGAGGGGRLTWKIGKEKLFSEDPGERHVGATLVYIGGGIGDDGERMCLVECVAIDDGEVDECDLVEKKPMEQADEEQGGARMPKRRRGDRDVRRRSTKHLYLIFDDWPWGYSIREIDLLSPTAVDSRRRRHRRRLPRPIIHVEAPRGSPCLFAGPNKAGGPLSRSAINREPDRKEALYAMGSSTGAATATSSTGLHRPSLPVRCLHRRTSYRQPELLGGAARDTVARDADEEARKGATEIRGGSVTWPHRRKRSARAQEKRRWRFDHAVRPFRTSLTTAKPLDGGALSLAENAHAGEGSQGGAVEEVGEEKEKPRPRLDHGAVAKGEARRRTARRRRKKMNLGLGFPQRASLLYLAKTPLDHRGGTSRARAWAELAAQAQVAAHESSRASASRSDRAEPSEASRAERSEPSREPHERAGGPSRKLGRERTKMGRGQMVCARAIWAVWAA
nr:unnamed protein product [Digitaria exilis]